MEDKYIIWLALVNLRQNITEGKFDLTKVINKSDLANELPESIPPELYVEIFEITDELINKYSQDIIEVPQSTIIKPPVW